MVEPRKSTKSNKKAGGSKDTATNAANADAKPHKQKDPVGFLITYFRRVIVLIALVRLIYGPFALEKRVLEKLDQVRQRRGEVAAVKDKMRVANPLIFAAGDGDLVEVKRLIAAGHDVMERTAVGETPLHTAGISGNADIVKALLDAGADPDARTRGGQYLKMSPSHWMVFGNHEAGLAALIAGGANINLKNTKGQTPADMAIDMRRNGVKMLEMLVAAGGKSGVDIQEPPPEDDPEDDPAEPVTEQEAARKAQGGNEPEL